ncbi:MAG: alginate lyase family protein [Gemmatimonadaceae bacterium]|nr:alginate lyase family protein [Chitinophagaceae bacterium]
MVKGYLILLLISLGGFGDKVFAQRFIHPGIDQSASDLVVMRNKVLQGEEPYASAFRRLKLAGDSNFVAKPFTHVLRGPYAKPNIGGDELSRSASMAYDYAILWYISKEKKYADRTIAILNAWSPILRDFDYNDAKLLAAWTGHVLCNAAEIMRYSGSGWTEEKIKSFSAMMLNVYYPLLKNYYPQANGNWDAAIIHALLAIGIFTDNRMIFDDAVEHYLHAPVNGSIFKYIYASGQCQETSRDQAHVQLGLGEFAGAAQIAWTQNVDLFSVGNNRLANGYEYTAGFLFGNIPHSYGPISERAKNLRDDYEAVFAHYTSQGIQMTWTKKAIDSVRFRASRSVLTAMRAQGRKTVPENLMGYEPLKWKIAGAGNLRPKLVVKDSVLINPGEPIQETLNRTAGTGSAIVLKNGIHKISESLRLPSGTTLAGEGVGTILFLDPASAARDAIVNAAEDMNNITIANLVIEAGTRTDLPSDPNSARSYRGGYNRGGILFRSSAISRIKNIRLINLTVRNATFNGIHISGGENIEIIGCDISENGGSVVPGPKLQHNVFLSYCSKARINENRIVTSPFGAGIALDNSSDIIIERNEIARNAFHGLLLLETQKVSVNGNLIEGNDEAAIMLDFLFNGNSDFTAGNNLIQYNSGFALESYGSGGVSFELNAVIANGRLVEQKKLVAEKKIVLHNK